MRYNAKNLPTNKLLAKDCTKVYILDFVHVRNLLPFLITKLLKVVDESASSYNDIMACPDVAHLC